jgi:hypothetical protein
VKPSHAAPGREADDDPYLERAAPRAGLHVRLSYRYLTIPEVKDVQQHLGDDAFNGLSFDLYPVSGRLRLGLATQAAFASDGDYVLSEGLTVGATAPHARFAPFVELGVHGGVGRRSVWIPIDDHPSDYGTFFFLLTGDVGLDAHLGPRTALSVALGVQRSTFYLSLGDPMDPVVLIHDTCATFKVGIGF